MKNAYSIFLLVALPGAVLAQLPGVTEVQLSSPQHAGSDVATQSLAYSPDGQYVCFIGDTETDGASELWCADTDSGSAAIRVSGLLPSGTTVEQPKFNDDSDLLFYIAPGVDVAKEDLFMVPPDGSQPPVRLNAPLAPPGADVLSFRYIPETDQVTYLAASQVSGQKQLHVVSVSQPETVTILNGPLVPGGSVESYIVAADAGRVVYRADQQSLDVLELYSVGLDGAGAVKLSGPMVSGGDVFDFEVSDDGAWVAYRADEETDTVNELFLSAIEGGGSTKVSGTAVAGGDVRYYFFSPDSQWLLFTGDLATNGWRDLYSTPSDGSQSTPNVLGTQTQEAPEPPGIEPVPTILVTSDGSQVLFASLQGNASSNRLLRAPIDGSASPVVLTGGLTAVNRVEYVPGPERVVVRNNATPPNLYSIAVDGSSFIPLTSFSSPTINVFGLAAADGVVYLSDPDVDDRISVFWVDYLAQETQELSSASEFFRGLVLGPRLSDDGTTAYFVERHSSSVSVLFSYRLKAVALDSFESRELARLSNSFLITPEYEFLSFLQSPSQRFQVAYIADKEADEQADAYLATFSDGVFSDRFQ